MAPLKNLLVHLDSSARTATRLSLAASLARKHGAHLTGVFGQRAPVAQVGFLAAWPNREHAEAAQASKAVFEKAAAGMSARWIDASRGSDAALLRALSEIALYSDLLVLGQENEDSESFVPPELTEEILVNSGRPVLVVPYAGDFPTIGCSPLLAWNRSRESARALNDALMLLTDCKEATIVSVDSNAEAARTSCVALIEHLSCHGIQARAEILTLEDVGIMDLLLSRVSDLGADLLVMGAQGSLGLPFVSGRYGTRHVLRHMVAPVLMSN